MYTWILNLCIIKLYYMGFDPIRQLWFILKSKWEKAKWQLLSNLIPTNKPFTLDFWKTKQKKKGLSVSYFFLFSE